MDYVINMIDWLVFDSGINGYEISRYTGVSTSTVHRLKKGHQSTIHLSLANALKLYEMAEEAKKK